MDIQHPVVTKLRKEGLPDAEAVAVDYFGTEVFQGEYYFRFEGEIVHEDDLEEFLYEVLGIQRKQA